MRLIVAVLKHETSCMSPTATGIEQFGERGPVYGADVVREFGKTRTPIAAFLDFAKAVNADVVTPIGAHSKPSAPVTGAVFEQLIAPIVEAAKTGCDAILLDLHGAMVTQTYANAELELLTRLRRILPDTPIGVALDLHGNLAPEIANLATVIAGYKTFPHVDMYETGVVVANAIAEVLAGNSAPVCVIKHCHMLIDVIPSATDGGPMKRLVDASLDAEKSPGIISATVFAGFTLADSPYTGCSVVVVAEGDRKLAEEQADKLLDMAWSYRKEFDRQFLPLEEAITLAKTINDGPVLLIDLADNCSSGGTQDTMRVVEEVIKQGLQNVAVGAIKDPQAVNLLVSAGVGATVTLMLGGKLDMPSIGRKGEPLEVTGTVRAITDGQFTVTGPFYHGVKTYMGRSVVFDTGDIQFVITERSVEPWDVGVFTSMGIVPERKHYLLLKSRVAYKAAFSDMAKAVIECCGVGVTTSDLSAFKFKHLERPIYPLDKRDDWRDEAIKA